MGSFSPRPEKARAAAADSEFRIKALHQNVERYQFMSEIADWEHIGYVASPATRQNLAWEKLTIFLLVEPRTLDVK